MAAPISRGATIKLSDMRYELGNLSYGSGTVINGYWDGSCGAFAPCGTADNPTGLRYGHIERNGNFEYGIVAGRIIRNSTDYFHATFEYTNAMAAKGALETERYLADARSKDTREALAILSSVAGSMAGARRAPVAAPQAQSNVRPATPPTSRPTVGSERSSASTTPSPTASANQRQSNGVATQTTSASNTQPAMHCLSVTATPNNGWFLMKNTCNYVISVSWCYAGTSDCKNGDWGFTSSANILAGGTKDATTFKSRTERRGLSYAVCSGRDAYVQETGPKAFTCK